MLKRIHPLLDAQLLYLMRCMGHGDDLIVVDRNFPADSIAKHTITGELVTMYGADTNSALEAILSLFPLDTFVDHPMRHMGMTADPSKMHNVHLDAQRIAQAIEGDWVKSAPVERFAFYEEAKNGYCVVQTSEDRGYGCFMLKKGVLGAGTEGQWLAKGLTKAVSKRTEG